MKVKHEDRGKRKVSVWGVCVGMWVSALKQITVIVTFTHRVLTCCVILVCHCLCKSLLIIMVYYLFVLYNDWVQVFVFFFPFRHFSLRGCLHLTLFFASSFPLLSHHLPLCPLSLHGVPLDLLSRCSSGLSLLLLI